MFSTLFLVALTAVILFVIIQMPIKFSVQYIRKGENDYIDLKLLLHSIKVYMYRIYLVDFKLNHSEAAIHFKSAHHSKDSERQILKKIKIPEPEELLEWFSFLAEIYKDIRPVLIKFKKSLAINELSWKTRIGFDDPFITGTVVGLIWAFKGSLISLIGQRLNFLKPPVFKVEPDFNSSCLVIIFETIITTKIIHVLSATIKMLIVFLTAKKLKRVFFMLKRLPRKKIVKAYNSNSS